MQTDKRHSNRHVSTFLLMASILSFFLVPWNLARGDVPNKPKTLDFYEDCVTERYYYCNFNCSGGGLWAVYLCGSVNYAEDCTDTIGIRDCGTSEDPNVTCGSYDGCNT
jgi:hypothetical protein